LLSIGKATSILRGLGVRSKEKIPGKGTWKRYMEDPRYTLEGWQLTWLPLLDRPSHPDGRWAQTLQSNYMNPRGSFIKGPLLQLAVQWASVPFPLHLTMMKCQLEPTIYCHWQMAHQNPSTSPWYASEHPLFLSPTYVRLDILVPFI
jgi:hypothetical protein